MEDAALAAAGARVSLSAYSAYRPGDVNASATPAVSFTLVATNAGAAPLDLSFLLVLPAFFNDCWGDAGSPKVVATAPSAEACAAACAAAPAAQCSKCVDINSRARARQKMFFKEEFRFIYFLSLSLSLSLSKKDLSMSMT